jgi:type IV pilus assembly protein PilW
LATGIENMQVLYGEDTNGDGIANRYVTAANLVSWNNVVSLRVSLLVNSVMPGLPQPASVCLGCLTFNPPADRRLRAEFTTTVGLRNQ